MCGVGVNSLTNHTVVRPRQLLRRNRIWRLRFPKFRFRRLPESFAARYYIQFEPAPHERSDGTREPKRMPPPTFTTQLPTVYGVTLRFTTDRYRVRYLLFSSNAYRKRSGARVMRFPWCRRERGIFGCACVGIS